MLISVKRFFKYIFSTKYSRLYNDFKLVRDDNSLTPTQKIAKLDKLVDEFCAKYAGENNGWI